MITNASMNMTTRFGQVKGNLLHYYGFLQKSSGVNAFDNGLIDGFSSGIPVPFMNPVIEKRDLTNSTEIEEARIFARQHFVSTDYSTVSWWQRSHGIRDAQLYKNVQMELAQGSLGMDLKREELPESFSIDGFSVRKVESDTLLELWVGVVIDGFGLPPTVHEACVKLFRGLKIDNELGLFLGYFNGVPVATSQVYVFNKVAGIYWVSTIPNARNKGIATAITGSAINYGLQNDADAIVLHATPMAINVYKRMGFKEVESMGHFTVNMQ